MASFLDKLKVRTAIEDRTKFDLGCDHITTADWMEFNIVYNKELVPREKIDVNMETFTRLLPLIKPTFGRANINNRAFFVPYDVVWHGWDDFITDTPHVPYSASAATPAIQGQVPTFSNQSLLLMLQSSLYSTLVSGATQSGTNWDIHVIDSAGGTTGVGYYQFTAAGRRVYKLLQSLGYQPIFDVSCTEVYSALPLMCACKIYIDWYYPSAYANTTNNAYTIIDSILKRDDNSTTGVTLSSSDLTSLTQYISFVNYDSDYFVSCWDNPVAPNNGLSSTLQMQDTSNSISGSYVPSGVISTPGSSVSATPTMYSTASGTTSASQTVRGVNVTQLAVDMLKKVTDYLKRHQLVGGRALDRFYARFGVQMDFEKEHRSIFLGLDKVPLQIGDVMSNTATIYNGTSNNNAQGVGEYAGKGLAYGAGHFDYETNKYGQFMIISTIIPAIGYYQGRDKSVTHISKFDFFTPEFDALGTYGVSAAEAYVDIENGTGITTGTRAQSDKVFGWLPRYAEYKVARDKVTGDFRVRSRATGESAWYLMRDLSDYNTLVGGSAANFNHNFSFVTSGDRYLYDRIFQNASSLTTQPFKMIYHFEIASYSPMKPLFDSYEFDGGKSVVEDVNGVRMN